ncbi:MAG: radical SAM protein [Thermoprotei archaeon]|jgi:wyosine [tRNA(Phe)-imidazoG37] synthetase (radical SAM superfamily)
MKYVFGPVPSRRLGRSLGINNIPQKNCSYSCIYCQIGRTTNLIIERKTFYPWPEIVNEVINAIKTIGEENIDYITFVPDGEPTLDIFLGKEIREIRKRTNKQIAVLTNASLLFKDDVKDDLYDADLTSIKIDTINENTFKKINRPHPKLTLIKILEGIKEFTKHYKGKVITETMLIKSFNDNMNELQAISNFISEINPYKAYIAIPTRPPAENFARKPNEETILRAYEIFSKHINKNKIELLIEYEGENFKTINNPIESLLNITSVHPMRIDYAYKLLHRAGLNPEEILETLINENKISLLNYEKHKFILRKINSQHSQNLS